MTKYITVTHAFEVDDSVTSQQLAHIVATMSAQIDGEALIGHDDNGNEQTVPVYNAQVQFNH